MTDENWELKKKFGRKINKEKSGFTEVDYDGIARPVLKIPSNIPKGRRRLTAVYTDERQKVYRSSLARTWLIYGSKCWIHCPTIYHPIDKEYITFTANLFANNRPVPAGNSKFKYQRKTVSKSKLRVRNGYVEETHKLKPKNGSKYTCNYEGDEKYKISEGEADGLIIVYTETRNPLVVDVMKLVLNEIKDSTGKVIGEKGKLVARVSHRNHGNDVKVPDDVPASGNMTFFIDGEQYGNTVKIAPSGIATVDYTVSHSIGVHTIVAVYEPDTAKMKEKYQATSGSNTLFIGNDKNRPKLTQIGKNCGLKNAEHVLEFKSSRKLNGKIIIYMDGIPLKANETTENGTITFLGAKSKLYELPVNDVSSFKFTFTIPDNRKNASSIWGYAGNHNMIIQYIETDEELGDMEYWYFWEDFYIQIETKINIDEDLDNTSDGGKYTGNNMYVHENDNTVHFKPTTKQIPISYVAGNPLHISVDDTSDGNIIKNGKVKVTITTRKKEKWVE